MIRYFSIYCALVGFIVSGCTSTRTIVPDEYAPRYEITSKAGIRAHSTQVTRRGDSLIWIDATGQRRALARSEVASFRRMTPPFRYRSLEEGTAEINELGLRKRARVVLSDGTTHVGNQLRVTASTASWIHSVGGQQIRVPTQDLVSIRFRDGRRGALRGLVLGILVGGLTGAAIGYSGGDDPPGWFAWTAEEKAALGALALGIIGGPVGALIGSQARRSYLFVPPREPTSPSASLPGAPVE